MRRYLLAFFARILFQESEKDSEQKFKAYVLLAFLWIVIPFYVYVFSVFVMFVLSLDCMVLVGRLKVY